MKKDTLDIKSKIRKLYKADLMTTDIKDVFDYSSEYSLMSDMLDLIIYELNGIITRSKSGNYKYILFLLPCLEKLIYYEDITTTSPIYQKMDNVIEVIDDLLSKHHNKDLNSLLIKIRVNIEELENIINSDEYINRQKIEEENRKKAIIRREMAITIADYILFNVKDIKMIVKLKDDYFKIAIIDSSEAIIKKLCGKYLKAKKDDKEYYKLLFAYLSSNPEFKMKEYYGYIEETFNKYIQKHESSKEELKELLEFISNNNVKNKYNISNPIKIENVNINYNEELVDLRNKYIFTIDSKNAECLDDAISFEQLKNGNFVITVYITDLSSIIIPDSDIDRYAYNLAETIYHTSVTPMLPINIHNDYCSLITGRDKIVHAYSFEVNEEFTIVNANVKRAIIRVNDNYTYDKIDDMILHSDTLFANELRILYQYCLYLIRNNVRRQRYIENKEIIDPTRKVIDRFGNNPSNRIVSELKVLTNSYLAINAHNMNIPFIYRNNLYREATMNGDVKKILDDKEFNHIKSVLNSSFSSSYYSDISEGHYGLDLESYAHVTTPLRNYSSLFNQRMVTSCMINDELPGEIKTLQILAHDIAKSLNRRIVLNKIYCMELTNKRKALTKN